MPCLFVCLFVCSLYPVLYSMLSSTNNIYPLLLYNYIASSASDDVRDQRVADGFGDKDASGYQARFSLPTALCADGRWCSGGGCGSFGGSSSSSSSSGSCCCCGSSSSHVFL